VAFETEYAAIPREQCAVSAPSTGVQAAPFRLTWIVVGLVTTVSAILAGIGADARWLAALGREIVRLGHIPDGVPFAAAHSSGWENVPVLAELAFHGLEVALGDRGLVLAQVVAVALCFALVTVDMRRGGAADSPAAGVLLLVAVGSSSALVVARAQLFSLALFPLVVVLLRADARSPSRRIWLLAPIVALWSNLHGSVLVGLAVGAVYLLLSRLRRSPVTALTVLAVSAVAVLATPSFLRTTDYYWGVLHGEAPMRGEGLWAPLSLSSPVDVVFDVVALLLVLAAVHSRPHAWELAVLAALALSSIHTSRTGVWLLLFAATPAACRLTGSRTWRDAPSPRVAAVAAIVIVALLASSLARGPKSSAAGKQLRAEAARAAGTFPVFADDVNAEALALDGHLVWISNPLDAFARREQRTYLDWLAGRPSGDAELAEARVVLVRRGTLPERRLAANPAFREAGRDKDAVLYIRGLR
jgi:hypothetical protein